MQKLGFLGLVLITAGACASNPSERDVRSTSPDVVSVSTSNNSVNANLHLRRDDFLAHQEVAASREEVWSAVGAAFDRVGLPAPTLDSGQWTATLENHVVQRRLGGQSLSSLLECGRGFTGANANTHRIHLDVTLQLVSAEDPSLTNVYTRIEAIAENPSGTTDDVACTTRGVLEREIGHALQLEVLEAERGP